MSAAFLIKLLFILKQSLTDSNKLENLLSKLYFRKQLYLIIKISTIKQEVCILNGNQTINCNKKF